MGALTCRRPAAEDDDEPDAFYEQLSFCDVADVLRFVNRQCRFLSALTPLQPRYAKTGRRRGQPAGRHRRPGHEPWQRPHVAHQRHSLPRAGDNLPAVPAVATLQAANDRISNAIAELPIFPHYSFDLETLYGSVDGQKFGVERPDCQGAALAQVLRSRQGRRRLHAAVQPRAAAGLADRRARVRGAPRLRHLVPQHVGHRARPRSPATCTA
jgi:hypothetical protein